MSIKALAKNLKLLMTHQGNLTVTELARETGIPQPTLHHILSGTTKRPRRYALQQLAQFFSVTVNQLLGVQPLPDAVYVHHKESSQRMVPIVDLQNLLHWLDNQKSDFVIHEITYESEIGEKSFGIYMPDASMEPIFPHQSLLISDPQTEFKDRDFVLIYLNDRKCLVVKRLFLDSGEYYIQASNMKLTEDLIKLGPKDKIIATIVECRIQFK